MYIGWATNINKEILDSTSVTVGENATVTDNLESGGQKKSRLASANVPDKFNVTMAFSFDDESKDANGYTELERFWIWYKYRHCYGVNPFKFNAILINSNRQNGDSVESRTHSANAYNNQQSPSTPLSESDIPDFEYYRITSAVEGSKSGNCLLITMTWETAATGSYTIPDEESSIDYIDAENGYVDVILTSTPDTEPIPTTWTVQIKQGESSYSDLAITNCVFDGDLTARLYFTERTIEGVYTVKIDTETSVFVVGA